MSRREAANILTAGLREAAQANPDFDVWAAAEAAARAYPAAYARLRAPRVPHEDRDE